MKTPSQNGPPRPSDTDRLKNESKRTTQQIKDLRDVLSTATEKAVQFEIEAPQDCHVFIAGTFNDWNPTTHPLQYHPEDETFRATLLLEPGTYEYKFVINGIWHSDIKCPDRVFTDNGYVNSVIRV